MWALVSHELQTFIQRTKTATSFLLLVLTRFYVDSVLLSRLGNRVVFQFKLWWSCFHLISSHPVLFLEKTKWLGNLFHLKLYIVLQMKELECLAQCRRKPCSAALIFTLWGGGQAPLWRLFQHGSVSQQIWRDEKGPSYLVFFMPKAPPSLQTQRPKQASFSIHELSSFLWAHSSSRVGREMAFSFLTCGLSSSATSQTPFGMSRF